MKKSKLFSMLLISFLTVGTLTSCGGGGSDGPSGPTTPTEDTTAPVIKDLKPDGTTVYIGDSFNVTADVTDNVALASYKIDIHYANDTHSATTTDTYSATTRGTTETPFSYIKDDGVLSGTVDKVNQVVELPLIYLNNPSLSYKVGPYHVVLTVLDKAGNETKSFKTFNIAYRPS